MAKLIQVRCPSCRREMLVDPERELSTCFSCSAQSFVITATRPRTPQLATEHRWFIDARPKKVGGGIVALLVVSALGVASAMLVPRLLAPPSPRPPPVKVTKASPRAPAPPQPHRTTLAPEPVPLSARPLSAPGARRAGEERLEATTSAEGTLPREVIQRIIRSNYGQLRRCYEKGLSQNPKLQGKVRVRFRIGSDGSVRDATDLQEDFPDADVVSCLLSAFKRLQFPTPRGGDVSVVYPLRFATK